ncbi:uncharacterized protein LOC131146415 [Malania oleifera]|uniref:uncharacterized protein LOC131146415 n=1 Tax=Malania oleifera TaxID=397392 RepID=UPI0025AE8B34|nr:uncharacterized protein LOC131146415 [Malania oleifera]
MIESSSLIFFFTMILWALNYLESGASQLVYEYCKVSKCRHHHGPAIRYPFRLQHLQPEHCSYPQRGFTLSCTDQDDTALDLALPQHEHIAEIVKQRARDADSTTSKNLELNVMKSLNLLANSKEPQIGEQEKPRRVSVVYLPSAKGKSW